MKLADYKGAAAAFEQSMAAAPNFDILQKLALAYENDRSPQLAVAAVEAAGRALPGNTQEQADLQGYGGVEISLLLGRVYSRWPGHDSQALDLYDRLIANKPDDFRYDPVLWDELQYLLHMLWLRKCDYMLFCISPCQCCVSSLGWFPTNTGQVPMSAK